MSLLAITSNVMTVISQGHLAYGDMPRRVSVKRLDSFLEMYD